MLCRTLKDMIEKHGIVGKRPIRSELTINIQATKMNINYET